MYFALLSIVLVFHGKVNGEKIYNDIVKPPGERPNSIYSLPSLPYDYSDLEPYIDERTVRVHHLGHHKSYTEKMNAALLEWRMNVRDENRIIFQ